jgi:hypothetical protein
MIAPKSGDSYAGGEIHDCPQRRKLNGHDKIGEQVGMRALLYMVALALVVGGLFLTLGQEKSAPLEASPSPGDPRTFYVDRNGDDRNDGLREDKAWKTLAAIQRATLAPGDHVLLRRGQVWRESLNLAQSGIKGARIHIGAYGAGAPPTLRGSDTFIDPSKWREDGRGHWYLSGLESDPAVVIHDGQFGTRRGALASLEAPWEFYYDTNRRRLYVRTAENPAELAQQIEIPVREFVIGPLEQDFIEIDGLDLGHGRSMSLLAWDGDHLTITNCTFSGSPENHIQFQQGSNFGKVTGCRFDDWNLLDRRAYAIQVIEKESGPVDIEDCVFTASRQGGGEDHAAIMNDFNGWVRTVKNCQFIGNGGKLADEGVVIWRPAATADKVTIEGNTFTGLGGTAIMVQELGHYGAAPTVKVLRNRIENVCIGDDLDKEAIRARQFGETSTVLIAYNLINGTAPGNHSHPGIGVQVADGLRIANNLVRGADVGIEFKREVNGAWLRNNILLENRGAGIRVLSASHGIDSNHNGFNGNTGRPVAGIEVGPNSVVGELMLNDKLRPKPDSPCIDGGVMVEDVHLDLTGMTVPQGKSADIGAIEQ